jgi:nucleotide-binding universal stress UspA family protein
MFSNIVVGTDGSETAKLAVTLAADLARKQDAVLHLVNAYKAPLVGAGVLQAGPVAATGQETVAKSLEAASHRMLAEAAVAMNDLSVETHSGKGAPADVVINVAEEVGAELIVVGSKGMQGARRMIGSVPNSIAHHAPCHVLIAKTA